jgi:hypothetical protein
MENFIKFITSLIKFLIIIKMGYLFTMNYLYPEEYPLSNLTWWIYFLVFDIWVMTTINSSTKNDVE